MLDSKKNTSRSISIYGGRPISYLEMLDRRVNKLIRQQYRRRCSLVRSDAHAKILKQPVRDYLTEKNHVSTAGPYRIFQHLHSGSCRQAGHYYRIVIHAEAEYSLKRLRSLYDEWYADYPELPECRPEKSYRGNFR